MRKFKGLEIEIENSGSAFDGADSLAECARLLRKIADELENGGEDYEHTSGALHDINGNRCGYVSLDSEDVEPDGWLCDDCLLFVANGDLSGVDEGDDEATDARCREIEDGARALGNVSPDSDMTEEFSRTDCDCCGTALAGSRTGFYRID